MNITEQIIQFAITRNIGLNFESSRATILAALGPHDYPEYDYDQYLFWGDLEIGFVPKNENLSNREIAYFKFCLERTNTKRFSIPSLVDVKYSIGQIDIREVVQVLVNHSIWFKHVDDFAYKDVNRGIQTIDGCCNFHFKKKKGRWLLTCYFCDQI
jgi:hypothetical protein